MARPKAKAKTPMLSPAAITKALANRPGAIDSGGLLTALIDCWGGPTQFARDVFGEFQAAPQGGQTRQRILDMISRLTVQVTQQDIAKPRKADDMSDDELVKVARSLMEKMYDGDPAPAATPQA